ncbi:helix-turn-helix domain-containing protein [Dyadobacter arcticus]|uniref:AraC-like DNA-binding protein n=1 Tax=Dyadobacter arcticus TaxID=1078754 RepID=A0ABX0UUI4_9BACT|nr:helix-turn-helix domain-containing protein [Dyadobacter arcticus]NIJ54591.1 AraC-like DNA-binding protein [Dyadobacter arcticus]
MDAIFDYRSPSPGLRCYVRQLQIVGCSFPESMAVLPVKSYWPRGEDSLAFYPKDTEEIEYGFDGKLLGKPCSTLNGQYTIVTNRYVGRNFMVFQVQFQPGALFRLTGIPACELTNSFLDAEAVFGSEIRRVNERLSYTSHYTEMIPIVENFLFYLINRTKPRLEQPIDKVGLFMLQNPGTVSLEWLADQACLSTRQFYQNFIQRTGVSPKLYNRIIRFDKAMKMSNAQPRKDWLSIAVESGYYDYQHMVRDFKEFTKLTPNEFSQHENHAPERIFGRKEG